jgi:hypothetical protein
MPPPSSPPAGPSTMPPPSPGYAPAAAPYGQPAYQQQAYQPQQQAYQPQQQAYQQQAYQPQQQAYQQAPQQQAYQQAPQQQHQQHHMPPPVAAVEPEEERKSKVGLIIGIVGGVVAILGVVAFFVFGPGLGGGDKDKGEGGTGDEKAQVADGEKKGEAAVGGVTVDVTPADAKVMIDGKEYAGSGPRSIPDLTGIHKLEVSMDGFLPYSQDVDFAAGQNLPIKLEASDVTLSLTVTPPTAAISLIAGTATTQIGKGATLQHKLKREAGLQYTIKATADGYDDLSLPIVFTGDPTQDVPVVLVAKAGPAPEADPGPSKPTKKTNKVSKPKNAELKIGVAPGNPPAAVTVDGKSEGRTPVFVKVTAGSHTVKWKWDDGKTDTEKVSVNENQSLLLKGSK